MATDWNIVSPRLFLRSMSLPVAGATSEFLLRYTGVGTRASLYERLSPFFFSRSLPPTNRPWYSPYHYSTKYQRQSSNFTSYMARAGLSRREVVTSGEGCFEEGNLQQQGLLSQAEQQDMVAREEAYLAMFGQSSLANWEGLPSNLVTVGFSDIHYRGLFAKRDIPKGAMVLCQRSAVFCDGAAFTLLMSENLGRRHAISNYAFPVGGALQLPLSPNPSQLLNHSCEPNVRAGFWYKSGSSIEEQLQPLTGTEEDNPSSSDPQEQQEQVMINVRQSTSSTKQKPIKKSQAACYISLTPPPMGDWPAGRDPRRVPPGTICMDPNAWIATRNIPKGTELTINYNRFTAPLYPSEFLRSVPVPCHCGKPSCVGEIFPKIKTLKFYANHQARMEACRAMFGHYASPLTPIEREKASAYQENQLNESYETKRYRYYSPEYFSTLTEFESLESCDWHDDPIVALSLIQNRSALVQYLTDTMFYSRFPRWSLLEQLDTSLLFLNAITPGKVKDHSGAVRAFYNARDEMDRAVLAAGAKAAPNDRRVAIKLLQAEEVTGNMVVNGAAKVKNRSN